jgi:hypothetical protein
LDALLLLRPAQHERALARGLDRGEESERLAVSVHVVNSISSRSLVPSAAHRAVLPTPHHAAGLVVVSGQRGELHFDDTVGECGALLHAPGERT